jgi:hypothetical protein
MARYAALLSTGSYAARYLGIGLGGDAVPRDTDIDETGGDW